jgi:5'-phosphate synthase pdxT subunit
MSGGEQPNVGVLAIQGAFDKHMEALGRAGATGTKVLRKEDLEGLAAVILPGGESTTIAMGLERLGLYEPLQAFADRGGAVLGTCAGAILLARECENQPVRTLGLLDVRAARNAYGTQVDSFTAPVDPGGVAALSGLRCVFIRAPQLLDPGPEVEVLLRVDGLPVLVRQGRILASTFHPELTDDLRVHQTLIALARSAPG